MARPKMKFAPEAACALVAELSVKLKDYQFRQTHLVFGTRQRPLQDEAVEAFKPLYALYEKSAAWNKEPAPLTDEISVLLQQWLQTYFTEDGWKRMLANKRQRKASSKMERGPYENLESSVTIRHYPSYVWGTLAEELGIDKKELLSTLPAWFQYDDKGKAAFKAFSAIVHSGQEKAGLALLVEVFQLSANSVKTALFEAAGFTPAIERESYRFAHRAGKPKLVRLSKVLKALPALERLKTLVAAMPDGKSLLELAGTGKMDAVLKALGASDDAEPLGEGAAVDGQLT